VWKELGWLAAAGAAGTLCRYGLGGLVQRFAGEKFPWGTLAVNAAGCFLFGVVWTMAEERMLISGRTRTIVLVGFMGAFTTFSTYAFETSSFLRGADWWPAAANVLAQNLLGLLCVFLGFAAGRWL
jgi:fluoride exporter